MKIKLAILKKPSVIIGAVVLFFVLLFLLNRGSGSSASNTTTTTTGPDPATVAAQMQLAGMQISAAIQGQAIQADYAKSQDANQTQIALATIAAAANAQQTAAQQDIAAQTLAVQQHGLDLQYQTAIANNTAQIQAMQVQAGTLIDTAAINANLQAELSKDQLSAFTISSMTNAIASISGKHEAAHKDYAIENLSDLLAQSGNLAPPTGSSIVNIPTSFLTPVGGSLH